MLHRNALPAGLLLGLFTPLLGYALLFGVFAGLEALGFMSEVGFRPYFRERTTSIIAIALNAILLNRFYKMRYTETMRGIVIMTFVYVVLWVVVFWKVIFSSGTLPFE